MSFHLGDAFPDFAFEASGVSGKIQFHDFIGDKWCILFSHPSDFTPVCTTELAMAVRMHTEFDKLGCRLIALSCDSKESHEEWAKDILAFSRSESGESGAGGEGEGSLPFPIIADEDRSIAAKLGIMDPDEKTEKGLPLTCRSVFFIEPLKKTVAASILYPATTGRNFFEILRTLKSLQLTRKRPVATPQGWTEGSKCMVVPSLSNEDAHKEFTGGIETKCLPSKKEYMRFTCLS